MKKSLAFPLIALLVLVLSVFTGSGQVPDTFRVGDTVEYKCNCFGQEWVSAKVEAVERGKIRVRYGNMKNQVATVTISPEIVRTVPKAETANDIQRRVDFGKDASKYFETITQFAPFYDSQYLSGGSPITPAQWQKAMSDLAELDTLCKSKYAGIGDQVSWMLRNGDVNYRYAVWCEIAAKRVELEKPARTALAKNQISLTVTKDNLNFAFNHQKNRVPDETQMLMYDRAKWKQEQTVKFKPRFTEFGVEMPADFFSEVEKRADELKLLIEQTAPNRSWEQPAFHDPAVEAFIKARYAGDPDYRGVKILKSGVDYKTWVERKGLSYLGSDSSYRYYKVEYNYYKRGWVLMQLPNRPFCQASEWIVGRGAKGMVVVSLGGSGIFVKCQ